MQETVHNDGLMSGGDRSRGGGEQPLRAINLRIEYGTRGEKEILNPEGSPVKILLMYGRKAYQVVEEFASGKNGQLTPFK
ncbi:hypothetical protein MTR_7g052340 [Medicago truncatula]|uniref:Uncharacterized protein n=1 Tax=Medicago truncatula TaxID=3880 RepID=G7KY31_MEDTR|nr:hypothetical protein MTR_7g052340 [Medicago truncatula]